MTEDDEIASSVERHGWHAITIAESEHSPSFLYTIGLCHKSEHPDAILFGLEADVAYPIVAAFVSLVQSGRSYAAPGTYEGLLGGRPAATRPVHSSQHSTYLGYAMGYYRHIGTPELLRAVQLFWPDKAGRFPFEVECDPFVSHLQPRLELPEPRPRRRRW